jgi:hypothetical protein
MPPEALAKNRLLISASEFQIKAVCYTLKSVFLKLGPTKGCQVFCDTKVRNAGRVLLTALNLYVRFKISAVTFDPNHSVTDNTQTVAVSIQKLPDSPVKSASRARLIVDVSCQTIRLSWVWG